MRTGAVHFLRHLANFDKKIKYDSLKYSRRGKKRRGPEKLSRAGPGRHCWQLRPVNSERNGGETQVHRRPVLIPAVPSNACTRGVRIYKRDPPPRIMTSRGDDPNANPRL